MNSVPPFIPEHPLIERSDQFDQLAIIGVSARTAGRRLRDTLFVEEPDYSSILDKLKSDDKRSVVLIATCERFDFVLGQLGNEDIDFYQNIIAQEANVDLETFQKQSYQHTGFDALRHLFAVAASLDSLIVGEPQILGQVKECHRVSKSLGLTDSFLDSVFDASLVSAKRVRTETTIAQQPISLASSALQVARGIHGDLTRCTVSLIGSGEVGELLCQEFKGVGIGNLVITHPKIGRSQTASFRLGGEVCPWNQLDDLIFRSDIVLSAYGGGDHILSTLNVGGALRKRKRKPVFFIDTTAARDIAPDVNDLDGAYSYNLDDLESVAKQGKVHREAAMMAAWKVLGDEMQAFIRAKAERQAVPAIAVIRKHFETLRSHVLLEAGENADAATRLLINRLLHNPQVVLKEIAREDPDGHVQLEQLLYRFFGIETALPDNGKENDESTGSCELLENDGKED
ncbi:glutamyl-tRNA reductase [Kiloniella spongiae]|uniref:glutamyl-tRNA reductase n=1 Tax=Kiloniella spongiae TaxID=1489064 RepID=UPI00069AAE37|nr:glutamyl-tRNA reductase [Kiloniella spongiae]